MGVSSSIERFWLSSSCGTSGGGLATGRALCALFFAALLLGGCAGAHYRRPDLPIPPSYRGEPIEPVAAKGSAGSLGELRWQDLIHDETLSKLIEEALSHNFDVQIAATRVLQARAQLTITRSALFPLVNAQGNYSNSRMLAINSSDTSLSVNAGWQLDLWGQIRNQTAAARAGVLASKQARRVVLQTLVGDVASNYFCCRTSIRNLNHSAGSSNPRRLARAGSASRRQRLLLRTGFAPGRGACGNCPHGAHRFGNANRADREPT